MLCPVCLIYAKTKLYKWQFVILLEGSATAVGAFTLVFFCLFVFIKEMKCS